MADITRSEQALSVLSLEATKPERALETLHIAFEAVKEFSRAKSPDNRLTHLQRVSQFSSYLPNEVLRALAAEALQDEDPRIRGEMCYALGMSGIPSFIPELQLLKKDPNAWVREQAEKAISSLEKATPTASDYERLLSQVEGLVKEVRMEGSSVSKEVARALSRLSKAEPGDIQEIAASQIKILDSYYGAALSQAKGSFRWACVAAFVGLIFFVGAVVSLLVTKMQDPAMTVVATIGAISGAIVEVISGIYLFMYGKATVQLSRFFQQLDQTQRFLLANSICESLRGEVKQNTRAELVKAIATLGHLEPPMQKPTNEKESLDK
jgi:hypothetical protein